MKTIVYKTLQVLLLALLSHQVFARDEIDELVARMNPPKSIEDPRNAICAKNDRGFMRYSSHDVSQRAGNLDVQLALYKWGKLHFPNARDAQKCPNLNFYQLTLHWRSAYELPTGTGMWDDDAMKTFERLVEGGK